MSYRSGKSFKCGPCDFDGDGDINAELNIAALGFP
jgi:putative transposase